MANLVQSFYQLEKFDPFQGVFTAKMVVGGVVDRSQERLDYAGTKPYIQKWSDEQHESSGGKSYGNIRLQHDPKRPAGILTAPPEFNDATQTVRITGKIVDPVTKELLQEGALTGVSIGGAYVSKRTNPKDGVTDYIANPSEVSVVDRPCLREATFEVVKNEQGDVEVRKFASEETSASLIEKYLGAPTMSIATEKALNDKIDALTKAVADLHAMQLAKAESVATQGPSVSEEVHTPPPDASTDAPEPKEHPATCECSECGEVADKVAKSCKCAMCEHCVKRDFSDKERQDAASSGAALPDGSFPIKNTQDLKNAIRAVGRAKDPAKAKAHIKARAKALGDESLIPDTWKAEKADFSTQSTEETMSKTFTPEELQKAHKSVMDRLHDVKKAATDHKMEMHKAASDHEAAMHEACDHCAKAIGEPTVAMETTKSDSKVEVKTEELKKEDKKMTEEQLTKAVEAAVAKVLGVEPEKELSDEEKIAKAVEAAIAKVLGTADPNKTKPRAYVPEAVAKSEADKLTDKEKSELAKKANKGDRESIMKMFGDTGKQQADQMAN